MFRKNSFLLFIVCILVLSLLGGCAQQPPEEAPEDQVQEAADEEKSTDVVVVGGGLAGLSAAISAADNGAKVILVEKMPFTGGSSMLSGGGLLGAETHVQEREGIVETKDDLEAYWYEQQAYSSSPEGFPDKEWVRMIIDEAPSTIKFIEDNGVEFMRPSAFYPETKDRLHFPVEGGGAGLTGPLADSAKEKGVEILLQTTATELIEKDGSVVGIKAEDKDGKTIAVNAKAVILANGGFAQNKDLMAHRVPAAQTHYSVSGKGNVGDGYKMAEALGVDFYEEDWIIGLRAYEVEGSSELNGLSWTTGLYTTLEGERFVNENYPYSPLYNTLADKGIEEYFLIFDQTMAAAVTPGIEQGVVFKGESIEELAAASGMNPEKLKDTIERYDDLAKKGKDEDFNKEPELMVPLTEGTLYALKVKTTQMGTMGGVKTTKLMEVLNQSGQIIPGLYAVGEMANRPFYGRVYVSGSALQIAASTGRIAGAAAAK